MARSMRDRVRDKGSTRPSSLMASPVRPALYVRLQTRPAPGVSCLHHAYAGQADTSGQLTARGLLRPAAVVMLGPGSYCATAAAMRSRAPVAALTTVKATRVGNIEGGSGEFQMSVTTVPAPASDPEDLPGCTPCAPTSQASSLGNTCGQDPGPWACFIRGPCASENLHRTRATGRAFACTVQTRAAAVIRFRPRDALSCLMRGRVLPPTKTRHRLVKGRPWWHTMARAWQTALPRDA